MKSRAAALISLTGDTELIRHLRLKAIKAGMHLNEFGLWRWISNGSPDLEGKPIDADKAEHAEGTSEEQKKSGFWQLIPTTTEEDIFKELGMDFVEPSRRNFAFLSKKVVPEQKKTIKKSASES
jgi:DNA polymerase beta